MISFFSKVIPLPWRPAVTKLSGYLAVLGVGLLLGVSRAADDYKVAAAEQSVPEEVAADIAKLITPESFKVTSGKRTICELWLRKAVPVQASFAPTDTVLYPFEVGQLVGVVRFARKTTDFRNQEIAAGVYTLRYGLQPVDGNHVGTSETRDFLTAVAGRGGQGSRQAGDGESVQAQP